MADKNVCRVCLSSSEKRKFIKIFEDDCKIGENIFAVAGVVVIEMSPCPSVICSQCLEKLDDAVEFRNLIRKSDAHFQRLNIREERKHWERNIAAIRNDEIVFPQAVVKNEPISEDGLDVLPSIKCEALFDEPSEDGSNGFEDDFFYSNDYNKHIFQGNPEVNKILKSSIKCHVCDKDFLNSASLRSHMTRHKKKSSRKVTAMPSGLVDNELQCKQCFRISPNIKALKTHMLRHREVGVKKIRCHKCPGSFISLYALEMHMKSSHDAEGNYICDTCGKLYERRSFLKSHIQKTHLYPKKVKSKLLDPSAPPKRSAPSNLKSAICTTCGKFFKSVAYLMKHEITHIEFKASDYYYCDLCGNKFKEKGSMGFHIKRKHIEKTRFVCPHCPGRSWAKRHGLNEHVRTIHEKIFDFHCEFCGKGFGSNNRMQQHRRIHTGETPYHCRYCERKFVSNTDCRRHEWQHTGYKGNIKCPNCNEGFFKNSDLQSHLGRCARRFF